LERGSSRGLLTGKAIRSRYRVIARDGHVVWFQCEAKVMLHDDGRPWFIHGIAFDITELKRTEEALQGERNVASAILDSVGTLVVVLDPRMRIVRFIRVCEETTGYSFADVRNRFIWDLMTVPEQAERFRNALQEVQDGGSVQNFKVAWESRGGGRRLISWSLTALRGVKGAPEATEASKIVRLVNEAIHKARELSRGLMPGLVEPNGLMSSLEQMAHEIQEVFGVSCRFYSNEPLLIHDAAVSTIASPQHVTVTKHTRVTLKLRTVQSSTGPVPPFHGILIFQPWFTMLALRTPTSF
jgi:PAS domain S-box-containing protein